MLIKVIRKNAYNFPTRRYLLQSLSVCVRYPAADWIERKELKTFVLLCYAV